MQKMHKTTCHWRYMHGGGRNDPGNRRQPGIAAGLRERRMRIGHPAGVMILPRSKKEMAFFVLKKPV